MQINVNSHCRSSLFKNLEEKNAIEAVAGFEDDRLSLQLAL
jgi:hypothetical protein